MFFTQAIILAVKCAWAARAFIVERCPMIWGVDTSCIIDRITDLFLYSKRDITVTIHKQTNTRANRLFNTFSLPFYVSVSILLKSIQMAKRSSRAARDQEEDDQSHARRRRRDNADDEVAT